MNTSHYSTVAADWLSEVWFLARVVGIFSSSITHRMAVRACLLSNQLLAFFSRNKDGRVWRWLLTSIQHQVLESTDFHVCVTCASMMQCLGKGITSMPCALYMSFILSSYRRGRGSLVWQALCMLCLVLPYKVTFLCCVCTVDNKCV